MLKRKIENTINKYFDSNSNKILIIDGARQIGKSFIIRELGKKRFENYIELNFVEDSIGDKYFVNITNKEDFYLQLSMVAGEKLKEKNNTLVFLDEIQQYPNYLTLL